MAPAKNTPALSQRRVDLGRHSFPQHMCLPSACIAPHLVFWQSLCLGAMTGDPETQAGSTEAEDWRGCRGHTEASQSSGPLLCHPAAAFFW